MNAVSVAESAPRISWIPAMRFHPATSAITVATSDAAASARRDRPPSLNPPEIQCCIDGASLSREYPDATNHSEPMSGIRIAPIVPVHQCE